MAAKKKTARKSTPRPRKPKSLYRSERDRVLGGVAGGLAEYFQIDVSLIRILFAVFTLTGGFGLILYFVLWLIIPTESGPSSISGDSISQSAEEMGKRAEEFAERMQGYSDKRDSRPIWGLVLLVIGAIFLFNNFGLLPWGVWSSVWRLWPLILIVIAISILRKK